MVATYENMAAAIGDEQNARHDVNDGVLGNDYNHMCISYKIP